jgi:hypothetical protein
MSKKGKRESSEKTSGTNLLPPNQFKALYLIVLALILSLIAYIPAFDAQFVNWDDQDYVMNNELIRSFTDFSKFFTTTVQGNYHPLTMLSLALNYAISGNNPVSYHALNILLHLVNVFHKKIIRQQYLSCVCNFHSIWCPSHACGIGGLGFRKERCTLLLVFYFGSDPIS